MAKKKTVKTTTIEATVARSNQEIIADALQNRPPSQGMMSLPSTKSGIPEGMRAFNPNSPVTIAAPSGASGTILTSGFLVSEDANPLWAAFLSRWKIIDLMTLTDAKIQAILLALKLPILGANWSFRLPDELFRDVDGKEVEALRKKADRILRFCEAAFFKRLDITFEQLLLNCLTMFEWGCSIHEIVHKVEPFEDMNQAIFYRQIAHRETRTLYRFWTDDCDDFVGITQLVWRSGTYQQIDIPAENLMVLTFNKQGADISGRSILRSAYRDFRDKDFLMKLDLMAHERHAMGIPVFEVSVDLVDPSAKDQAERVLEGIRAHEKIGVVCPNGWKFRIESVNSKEFSCIESIRMHEEAEANSVLANFLNLGQTKSGSRSLGEVMSELFMQSEDSYAKQVCETINRYLVHPLVKLNFGADIMPYLVFTPITGIDFQKLAKSIMMLEQSGALIVDSRLRGTVRDILGMPAEIQDEVARSLQQQEMEITSNLLAAKGKPGPQPENNILDPDNLKSDRSQNMKEARAKQEEDSSVQPNGIPSVLSKTSRFDNSIFQLEADVKQIGRDIAIQYFQGWKKSNYPFRGKLESKVKAFEATLYGKNNYEYATRITSKICRQIRALNDLGLDSDRLLERVDSHIQMVLNEVRNEQ